MLIPQVFGISLPLQWYMVSIVHTFNRIKANEVQVFVNGQLASRAELPFVSTKEVSRVGYQICIFLLLEVLLVAPREQLVFSCVVHLP